MPTAPNYIRQGVTTVMEGPDGSSPVPLAPFLAELEALKKSINIGSFIGQGSVRTAVIGNVDRKASADEIARMEALVDQGMKDGAFGMSTGLFYVPGTFTPTEEVIQLARVAGRYGGMHESHQRDEASKVVDSVKETIRIGEEGGLATHISHAKAIGAANWGRSVEFLRLVDEARARGVDVTLDQYPYTASATSVSAALLPAWAQEGSRDDRLARLRDPASRARVKDAIAALIQNERGGGDPEERAVLQLRLRRVARGKDARGSHAAARPRAHGRERRRNDDLAGRARRVLRDLPRDERRRSRAHPQATRRR